MKSLSRRGVRMLASVALAVPAVLAFAGPAQAEVNPRCAGSVQIGATAYVTVGGQTAASVKQYKGCGKNYAYTYVWQQYRASHGAYQVCTSIVTGNTLRDLQCSSGPDVWSLGANTLSVCTRALGGISDVAQKETEVRC
ncbi:hypothetical protein Ais01nite_77980 [Asanoa ishikariensis]|uniref:Secreted protein n=1 Tax=Asanoa ishikariensis TaxID=137265 RepID=A0A1H3KQ87_9ACTN|nr:hypothetical protein [Asanoa ishikariensis]GIF69763.1 hypothetical protein Ais01nite_77980 [Asanoa ishikariensis]SDY54176.1 hypothetical protein SAMN05421684_0268 [Asanoa ishikariensis]